jgi:hypothetical protein
MSPVTRSIIPATNDQRVALWLWRRAMTGEYTRPARPYPSTRSLSGNPTPLPAGQAAEPSDYRPEMADASGW